MKNSSDTIGNRTRDLPACSAVPQPTATPRAPIIYYIILLCIMYYDIMFYIYCIVLYFNTTVLQLPTVFSTVTFCTGL
jgi:transglutaminase/protease-like cytokinesis protein 3